MSEHHVELARDPSGSLELLAREASGWGAEWRREGSGGGRLRLPVIAGLRLGWVEGPVTVQRSPAGARLTFRVEESDYRLQKTSVAVLLFAALGALIILVVPFLPALMPALPLAFVLVVGAWLFIVARLRNSGPEEFLETLARETGVGVAHEHGGE